MRTVLHLLPCTCLHSTRPPPFVGTGTALLLNSVPMPGAHPIVGLSLDILNSGFPFKVEDCRALTALIKKPTRYVM